MIMTGSADSSSRRIQLEPLEYSDQTFDHYRSLLISSAAEYSIILDPAQAGLCLEHLLYVLQVNSYINLTSITSIDEGIILHILDSLLFTLPVAEGRTYSNFLDMGTGAGYPGIPFHIVTGCPGTLVDSVQKKINVVNTIADALQLDEVNGIHDRLETFALQERSRFDIVLARALAPLPTLVEYAAPLLADEGRLIVSKGVPSNDELDAGDAAASLCGLARLDVLHLNLPDNRGKRTIIVYDRVGNPLVQLPRAIGLAKKQPLA